MLSKQEIRNAVISTIRSFKRAGEVGMDDVSSYDELFDTLHRENVVLTDQQWTQLEQDCSVAGLTGVNMVHATNNADCAIEQAVAYGYHPAVAKWYVRFFGKIYLFIDEITECLYDADVSTWNDVRRATLFLLLHERYHSCQQASDISEQYKDVNSENILAVHDGLTCEQEADAWATFQLNNCYAV